MVERLPRTWSFVIRGVLTGGRKLGSGARSRGRERHEKLKECKRAGKQKDRFKDSHAQVAATEMYLSTDAQEGTLREYELVLTALPRDGFMLP